MIYTHSQIQVGHTADTRVTIRHITVHLINGGSCPYTQRSAQAWHTEQQTDKVYHSHTCKQTYICSTLALLTQGTIQKDIIHTHSRTHIKVTPVILWPCSLCEECWGTMPLILSSFTSSMDGKQELTTIDT